MSAVNVNAALASIRQNMTTGTFNPVTAAEIRQVKDTLIGLSKEDARAVIDKLSASELKNIAREMTYSGMGPGGMSKDQLNDFFNEMARDLNGAQLGKLANAFDETASHEYVKSEDNISGLASAVSRHSDEKTKVDFVKELAPKSVGHPENHPPQARAIADTISGMDPASAEKALSHLQPDQRRAVIDAAANVKTSFGLDGSSVTTTADTRTLVRLLETTSRISDPDTKARVFADATETMSRLSNLSAIVGPVGTKAEAEKIRKGLGNLLLSDTNGIMRELSANKDTANGSALSSYMKNSLKAKDFDTLGELQARLSLGNSKNEDPVARFERQEVSPGGGNRYVNAETAGYFAGTLSAAVKSTTTDAKEQGDLVNATLKSLLTVLDKSGWKGKAMGGALSVIKEWTQFVVTPAMNRNISDQFKADNKIFEALQPTKAVRTLPNGQRDMERTASSGAGSAFNGTWIATREHAKP